MFNATCITCLRFQTKSSCCSVHDHHSLDDCMLADISPHVGHEALKHIKKYHHRPRTCASRGIRDEANKVCTKAFRKGTEWQGSSPRCVSGTVGRRSRHSSRGSRQLGATFSAWFSSSSRRSGASPSSWADAQRCLDQFWGIFFLTIFLGFWEACEHIEVRGC